jgi:hypothetical protein
VDKDDTTVTETVFVESLGPLGHVNVYGCMLFNVASKWPDRLFIKTFASVNTNLA